jgi:hypothetical protein
VPAAAVVLKKRPWHPPRIVEEALGPEEFREMAQLLPTTRVWRKPCAVDLPLEPDNGRHHSPAILPATFRLNYLLPDH